MDTNDENTLQDASPVTSATDTVEAAPTPETTLTPEPSFAEKFLAEHPDLDTQEPDENTAAEEQPKGEVTEPETEPKTKDAPKNENPDGDSDPEPEPKDFRNTPALKKMGERLDKYRGERDTVRREAEALRPSAQVGSTFIAAAQKKGIAPDVLVDISMTTIASIGEGNAGLTPDRFKWWANLGVKLNAGDPAAIQEAANVLHHLGWKPPTPPDSRARADEIYKDYFADDVKNLNIDEDLARSKAQLIADKELVKAEPPKPAPNQQYVRQEPVQPQATPQQMLIQAVSQDLEAVENALLNTPNGPEIHAEVIKRIDSLPVKPRPTEWVSKFNEFARDVQRERTQPKRTPPASTGIRGRLPPQTSAAPGSREAERERLASLI